MPRRRRRLRAEREELPAPEVAADVAPDEHSEQRRSEPTAPNSVLGLQRSAGNAAVASLLRSPDGVEAVGAHTKTALALDDPRGPGHGHVAAKPGMHDYSSRLLSATGEMTEDPKMLAHIKDEMLREVPLDLSGFEPQLKELAKRQDQAKLKKEDWNKHQYFYKEFESEELYLKKQGENVELARSQIQEKVNGYNAWTHRANGFIMSIGRLDSMMGMLGIPGGNYDDMAAAVSASLAEAKVVAEAAKESSMPGFGARLDVPPPNQTVADAAVDTAAAARDLNAKYLGYQQNLLKLRQQKIEHEGDEAKAELEEINEVKEFVHEVGEAVDTTMEVIEGAPAVVENATTVLHHGEAVLNAHRNKRDVMAGRPPTHNPTFMTQDEHGNLIVRNVQTGTDFDPKTKEKTETPEKESSLPITPGKALDKIVDFVYAADVRRLTSILDQIATRSGHAKHAQEVQDFHKNVVEFQNALMTFAEKMTELQHQMEERRNAYLRFGLELDEFASRDAEMRRQGHGEAKGHEKFGTVMVVTSQLRETLAIGDSAAADDNAASAKTKDFGDQKADERDHAGLKLTEGEINALLAMMGGAQRFEAILGTLHKLFDGVEDASRDLFSSEILYPGGGARGAY